MKFFYIDKEIKNQKLKNFLKLDTYSEIAFQRSSFKEIINNSVKGQLDVTFTEESEIQSDEEVSIFWCSNVIFIELATQKMFLSKLLSSPFNLFFGDHEGYVYKGTALGLRNFLFHQDHGDLIFLRDEPNLKSINSIFDFRNIISENSHSRYFNTLIKEGQEFIKESSDIKKLEEEFSFLDNVPASIQSYYVKVSDFKKNKDKASYRMERQSGMDLSIRYITDSISYESLKNIFIILEKYFQSLQGIKVIGSRKELDFILNKNEARLIELQSWTEYGRLNEFINNHTIFSSVDSMFSLVNDLLLSNEKSFSSKGSLFSHGDLCFSNMILSEAEDSIVFIDPRGGDSFRTPYYDLAKISHSLMGGYDHIINNKASICFNSDMTAFLDFDMNKDKSVKDLFNSFLESGDYKPEIVALVQVSLFLSMLPLHIDDTKKVYMLALRASELISGIKDTKIDE